MSFAIDLIVVLAISFTAVIWLKERAVYLIFAAAYLQNFVLAYVFTNGLGGVNVCRSVVFLKEFLLLALFIYSLILLSRHFKGHWPRPLIVLVFFSAYCVLRFAFGALFLNDASVDAVRKLRMVCYPVQVLTVSMVISWLRPAFAVRFLRHMIYFLAVLAVIGIALFLIPGKSFWKQHADIATYNLQVKGDDPDTVIEEQGIPGTGLGREAFMFLSSFRAMSTFADPLAFGFAMAIPVILLAFYYKHSWPNVLMLAASAAALFFTFSRSCWIFVAIAFFYVWTRKGKYVLSLALAGVGILALLLWPPLAEFAQSDTTSLAWNSPLGAHAQGLAWFYQRAFVDEGNILGKGMADKVQTIPESGYAFLLEHFGLAAYVSFIWFCFSAFSYLRQKQNLGSLQLIGQAIPVCILVVMHTSQYPFAFTEYLLIWFVVGVCFRPAVVPWGLSLEIQPVSK